MGLFYNRWAYTAGLDGTILKWDVQRLCQVQKIELQDCRGLRAMRIHEEKIVCSKFTSILQNLYEIINMF